MIIKINPNYDTPTENFTMLDGRAQKCFSNADASALSLLGIYFSSVLLILLADIALFPAGIDVYLIFFYLLNISLNSKQVLVRNKYKCDNINIISSEFFLKLN